MAGFRVAYANEIDDRARDTYVLNLAPDSTTVVDERSVVDVPGTEILAAAGGELDVLDGSPPCQSWSMAGKRRGMSDERGELFSEFVGLVEETMPKAFVAENVEGLTMGDAVVPLARVVWQLRDAGYSVHPRVLHGHRYGVPQTRHRLFILGLREDLDLDAKEWFPEGRPEMTIGDALPHVARIVRLGRPEAKIAQYREEESWGYDRPAATVSASGLADSSWAYVRVETTDGELREPTVPELLALAAFPPDFLAPVELAHAWKMLGNSVAPPMMEAVASRVRDALLESAAA
jgi:DNA (cytosine-5)-methyltransferase 1